MTRLRRGLAASSLAAAGLLLAAAPSYADTDPGFGADPTFDQGNGGIPGWFVGLAVLAVVGGIVMTVWKVTTAQKLAKQSGMDPSLATQMTLLSDDGLDATYLASALRQPTPAPSPDSPPPASPPATVAARLLELKGLLDQGLVTQQEYDERRAAIIGSV